MFSYLYGNIHTCIFSLNLYYLYYNSVLGTQPYALPTIFAVERQPCKAFYLLVKSEWYQNEVVRLHHYNHFNRPFHLI